MFGYASSFKELEELYKQKKIVFIDKFSFVVSKKTKREFSFINISVYVIVPATRNISIFAVIN
ncbi:hypothetical protein HERIO_2162 [Hepatospora eriocheir]|uniref:Uncharacterized protein n=1 Tax=Hepatospora eriocheir TaxID=1081669 RepID=A0A1X0Q7Z2_9MICR|nr:hypothetical protein HERIO_2162 [Hepatospora eriocheir]